MSETTSTVRIVVGVDGSAASINALREGAKFAAELGGVVEAVAVWEAPAQQANYAAMGIDGFEDGARRILQDALFQAFGEAVPATVSARLVQGQDRKSVV